MPVTPRPSQDTLTQSEVELVFTPGGRGVRLLRAPGPSACAIEVETSTGDVPIRVELDRQWCSADYILGELQKCEAWLDAIDPVAEPVRLQVVK